MSLKPNVQALIITGPVGVGKSSVAMALSEILQTRELRHAVIDMDYLRHAYPRPSDDPFFTKLGYQNLASIWENYQKLGTRALILVSVIEDLADLGEYRVAVPGANTFVVGLHAPLEEIRNRLGTRESKRTINWYLRRAAELNDIIEKSGIEDARIETAGKSVNMIANEIIGLWESNGLRHLLAV